MTMSFTNWFRWLSRQFTKPRRSYQRSRFSPLLEALEDRSLPSCVVFASQGTLFIQGDDAANIVTVVASADSVSVQCDQARAATFDGIHQIVADLGGGDDVFDARFNFPPDSILPEPMTMSVNVWGGSGGDRISIFAFNPQPEPPIVFLLDAQGNAGDDAIAIVWQGQVSRQTTLMADGGDGNDAITANAHWQIAAGATAVVSLRGGTGADEVMGVGLNHVAVGGVSTWDFDGGPGSDRLGFQYKDAVVDGRFHVGMNGGDGDDLVDVRFDNVTINERGIVQVEAAGGSGGDRISCWGYWIMDAGHQDVPALAVPTFTLTGGAGNDVIEYITDHSGGDVVCDGGDGDDTLSVIANVDWNKVFGPNPPPGRHFCRR
jgi:Ca2+-binding RTX toxin-like protein